MNRYLEVLSASLATFATTNLDDAFLLTLLYARRIPARRIVAGQYLGFAAIVLLSLVGALAALAIPHRWIRFLGLVPLAIGVRLLLHTRRTKSERLGLANLSVASIALLTVSNGADNISVYVPFFVIARAQLWLILTGTVPLSPCGVSSADGSETIHLFSAYSTGGATGLSRSFSSCLEPTSSTSSDPRRGVAQG
ncbi:MAG TPA: cadmium resistance transporter [Candidatus Sulfotelmatobacter sp.]|nr:cadmium resistance transporter [Candidatus Sulfotelmatobacter sp.]